MGLVMGFDDKNYAGWNKESISDTQFGGKIQERWDRELTSVPVD